MTASDATRSPSSVFISVTPCVLRLMREISSTVVRMTMPSVVISISSWSGRATLRPTTAPVFSVTFMLMMPLPPRWVTRYSPAFVRLP